MRIIETKVFTIDELHGEALAEATRQAAEKYQNIHADISISEIVESARKAAEFFGMKLTDWSVGYYDRNYVQVDIDGYMSKTNDEKNDLVRWLNDNYEAGADGTCPFTGVIYDCYFFDYIKESGGVTYNNLHKIVPEAIDYLVEKSVRDEEAMIENVEYMREYASESGWEFTEYGDFYGYGG